MMPTPGTRSRSAPRGIGPAVAEGFEQVPSWPSTVRRPAVAGIVWGATQYHLKQDFLRSEPHSPGARGQPGPGWPSSGSAASTSPREAAGGITPFADFFVPQRKRSASSGKPERPRSNVVPMLVGAGPKPAAVPQPDRSRHSEIRSASGQTAPRLAAALPSPRSG